MSPQAATHAGPAILPKLDPARSALGLFAVDPKMPEGRQLDGPLTKVER
jgi:hypothetical protein